MVYTIFSALSSTKRDAAFRELYLQDTSLPLLDVALRINVSMSIRIDAPIATVLLLVGNKLPLAVKPCRRRTLPAATLGPDLIAGRTISTAVARVLVGRTLVSALVVSLGCLSLTVKQWQSKFRC